MLPFEEFFAVFKSVLCFVFVYPGSWPFAWFPDLALVHKFYLPSLVPNLYLPALAPNLCLPTLAINLYLQALAYNIITNLGPEFVFVFPTLTYDLYYRSGV